MIFVVTYKAYKLNVSRSLCMSVADVCRSVKVLSYVVHVAFGYAKCFWSLTSLRTLLHYSS